MPRVLELNSIDQLDRYDEAWRFLLAATPGASFFQSLDWLRVYWRHFGCRQQLRVLMVCSCGEPLGIAPLVVRRETTRVGELRVLTFPLDDWGTFYGPIGPRRRTILRSALKHLRRTPRDWDVLEMRWVNSALDAGETAAALRAEGFQGASRCAATVGMADLRGGWEAYWGGLGSHWRNNIRRDQRRLAAEGRVSYEHYRPRGTIDGEDHPRWDLYAACEQVARASWQAAAKNGNTLSDEHVRGFLRDAHRAAAAAGALDIHLLRLDGQPAAFAYNYHLRGTVVGMRTGFDPDVSRAGAGTVLLARSLRQCCELGDRTLDLGANYLECKRHWLTHTQPCETVSHYPWPALRVQALRLKRMLSGWVAREA